MPEPIDQPTKPLCTRRRMVLWAAGILLVLGGGSLCFLAPVRVRYYCWRLNSADPSVWENAIDALGRLGPEATPAVPLLVRHLETSTGLGKRAAMALAKIGPSARDALPALRKAMVDPKHDPRGFPDVHPAACWAVWKITGEDAEGTVTFLRGLTNDVTQGSGTAIRAIEMLAEMGPLAKSAIPELEWIAGRDRVRTKSSKAYFAAADEALRKIRGEEAK